MKLRSFALMSFLLLTIRAAHADIIFNITPSTLSGARGQTVEFTGTIENTGTRDIFLDHVAFVSPPGLLLNTLPLFANSPVVFAANGGLYSGPLFTESISTQTHPGLYNGSFELFGGPLPDVAFPLATQTFQVQVTPNVVPEPATLLLLVTALPFLLLWASKRSQIFQSQSPCTEPLRQLHPR